MIRTALICVTLALSACATTQQEPLVRIKEVPVGPPDALLTCRVQPPAPRGEYTQVDVAIFIERLAEAGEDCRSKLAAVRAWAERETQ